MSKKNKQRAIAAQPVSPSSEDVNAFVVVKDFLSHYMTGQDAAAEASALWSETDSTPVTRFAACLFTALGEDAAVGAIILAGIMSATGNAKEQEEFLKSLRHDPLTCEEIPTLREWVGEDEVFDLCLGLYMDLFGNENAPCREHILEAGICFRSTCYGYDLAKSKKNNEQASPAQTETEPTIAVVSSDHAPVWPSTAATAASPAATAAPTPTAAVEAVITPEKETLMENYKTIDQVAKEAEAIRLQAAMAAAPATPLSPPPAHAGSQVAAKGDGIGMTVIKVVGYTAAAALAVAAGVTLARVVADRFEFGYHSIND